MRLQDRSKLARQAFVHMAVPCFESGNTENTIAGACRWRANGTEFRYEHELQPMPKLGEYVEMLDD